MTHRIRMNEILEQWSFCRRANIDWNESQKNNEKFVKIKNVLIKKYTYKDIHY